MCHSVNVIYWLFDQSSMFSCFPACIAAVCISSMIKRPLGCWVYSAGIFIQRQGWAVQGWGGFGGTPAEDIKPKSHLMLIKDSEACLTHIFFPFSALCRSVFFLDVSYIQCFIIFDLNELESESHLQMSKSLSAHLLVPNRKNTEMNGVSSADQVLLWGVSLLHSPIIVGSCLLMTQSSSTENHYPGCVMEIVNVLCEGGSSKHRVCS